MLYISLVYENWLARVTMRLTNLSFSGGKKNIDLVSLPS
ncbi:hypothetical protein PRUB_b1494 [Pseudoalteromonas rubra]|uniref:Uncharacterized protein n=1 Tax=Pseudoalteromonas rubra TaxID=43658 RepID=A0A8T0C2E1_9GAMM|nr:hypothetical protein PRUB_b1494 [Pseudoalteromonas rubra]